VPHLDEDSPHAVVGDAVEHGGEARPAGHRVGPLHRRVVDAAASSARWRPPQGVGARFQVCCENGGCRASAADRAPGGRMHRGRYRALFHEGISRMDDEPREQISELEVQIEKLADALERCRKTALASKAAMGLGGILMAATTLGVVTFDPMVMVAGLAALLGGVVVFGSNTSTANQLSEAMRSAEAQRAALIGRLDIRLVEDAPANRHS
jgi:hypothetical protein